MPRIELPVSLRFVSLGWGFVIVPGYEHVHQRSDNLRHGFEGFLHLCFELREVCCRQFLAPFLSGQFRDGRKEELVFCTPALMALPTPWRH